MSERGRRTATLDRDPAPDQARGAAGDTATARPAATRNGIALGWLIKRPAPTGAVDGEVPDPLAVWIGEEIATRRQELGMSQHELAQAIGCDRSSVSRWEMGLRLPSLPHLIALGRALGCGARALLPE